jgi:hypothetical protein
MICILVTVKKTHDQMLREGDSMNPAVYFGQRRTIGKGMNIDGKFFPQGGYVTVTNAGALAAATHERLTSILTYLARQILEHTGESHSYNLEVGAGDNGPVAKVGFSHQDLLVQFVDHFKLLPERVFWRQPGMADVDQYSLPSECTTVLLRFLSRS